MDNGARFEGQLTEVYKDLFANNADYAYVAARTPPEALASKMTCGLLSGSANKDGEGIKRTCKILKIKHTYKAIHAYLMEKSNVS